MDVSVYEPFHAWTCHATTVLAWLAAVISVFITGYFSTFSLNICTKVTENCRETLPEVTQVTPLLQQTLSCYLYACYNLAPRVLKEWRHSFIELEEGMASFVHRVGEDKRKDVAVHQQHTVSCLKVTHLLSIEWITSFIRSVGEDNKKDVAEITQLQSIKWMTPVIHRVGEDKRKNIIVLQQSTLLVYKYPVSRMLKGITSFIHRVGKDKRKIVAVHWRHAVICPKC